MRGLILVVLAVVGLLVPAGCRRDQVKVDNLTVTLQFERTPPAMGAMSLKLTLRDARGQPVASADVRLEGNMNHAGMVPVFTSLKETEPGAYTGDLNFTMPGDWFVLVTAKLADGQTVERKIDVPGVTAS